MALEDLNDPDVDHTYFLTVLAALAGFGSVQLSGNGPEWDDYVGFDPSLNASLDRCSNRDDGSWWNYERNNLALPAGADLRTLGDGLVWQWDSVPDSQDCYRWETWAERKDRSRVSGSSFYTFDPTASPTCLRPSSCRDC